MSLESSSGARPEWWRASEGERGYVVGSWVLRRRGGAGQEGGRPERISLFSIFFCVREVECKSRGGRAWIVFRVAQVRLVGLVSP